MKRSYTISIPASFFWKRLLPAVFLIIIVGSIGGIIVIDRLIMPNVVGINRDVVTVPNVVRMPFEEGREAFFKAGLLTEVRG
ncbi:MAG: hypothetical protein JXA18_17085, partial [Chitinispirillaceae bacterium]|nr:hypothetical protein [Chitinispirillaceae bacterium]